MYTYEIYKYILMRKSKIFFAFWLLTSFNHIEVLARKFIFYKS